MTRQDRELRLRPKVEKKGMVLFVSPLTKQPVFSRQPQKFYFTAISVTHFPGLYTPLLSLDADIFCIQRGLKKQKI